MKRFAVLVMVVFVVSLLSACKGEPDIPLDLTHIGITEKDIIYLNGLEGSWDPEYIIFKSAEQRDEYINEHRNVDGLVSTRLTKYNDTFFNDFNLVVITKTGGHTGIKYRVEKIYLNSSNALYVRINRILPPANVYSPCIVTSCKILIPVKRDYFNGDTVEIKYRTTTRKK